MGRLETKERKWLPWLSHQFHQSRPGRGPQAVWAPPVLAKAAVQAPVPRGSWPCPSGLGEGAGFLLIFTAQPRAQARVPARRQSPQPQPGHLSPRPNSSKRRPRTGLALTPLRGRAPWRPEAGEQEKRPVVPPRSPSSRRSQSHTGRGLQARRAHPRRPASCRPPAARSSLASLLPGTLRVRLSGAAVAVAGSDALGARLKRKEHSLWEEKHPFQGAHPPLALFKELLPRPAQLSG